MGFFIPRFRGDKFTPAKAATLPHSYPCSTIGAEGLNFRVRNGNGCFPFAMVTKKSLNP